MSNYNQPLQQLLNRLATSDSSTALFSADEFMDWPEGALTLFLHLGLLQQAEPAKTVTCNGCEEYCPMEVITISANDKRPARAFISCDKRDDIGLVPVSFDRLKQWQITGSLLANVLSQLLELTPPALKTTGNNKYRVLGTLIGKKKADQIILILEGEAILTVSGHKIPLTEILKFNADKLIANKKALLSFVDTPIKPGKSVKTKNEARKKESQKQYAAWQKAYEDLKKKHSDKSDAWCAEKISKLPIANGKSAETIRRNMKK
jgi:hypothetical protein